MRAESRPLARSLNAALVLRTIVSERGVSRAAIARESGLSAVTVGAIVAELMDQGLVVESGHVDSTAGRPGRLLGFNASAYAAIGVKVADHRLTAAITDLRATVLAEVQLPLDQPSPESLVEALRELVEVLLAKAGLKQGQLLGVGVGLPGVVDAAAGTTHYSPFLDWSDVELVQLAEQVLDVPVFIENDVNTLALTERWFGLGQDVSDFLLVTIGQGVGLGVVIDGHLHSGARGGAGEFGHTVVDASVARCKCGNIGCIEAIASQEPMLEKAAALAKAAGVEPVADLRELYQRSLTDPGHAAIVIDAAEALGRGIANLINVLAPELVIVTGDGITDDALIAQTVASVVDEHVFVGLRDRFDLRVEQLPDGPWARGAASLVLGALFISPVELTPSPGGQTIGARARYRQ